MAEDYTDRLIRQANRQRAAEARRNARAKESRTYDSQPHKHPKEPPPAPMTGTTSLFSWGKKSTNMEAQDATHRRQMRKDRAAARKDVKATTKDVKDAKAAVKGLTGSAKSKAKRNVTKAVKAQKTAKKTLRKKK